MSLLPVLVRQEIDRQRGAAPRARWFLGIDLGTTKSTAAVVDAEAVLRRDGGDAIHLVSVRQETKHGVTESPILPSCVAEVAPGDWRVGFGAKEALRDGLEWGRRIFYSTKSEMGIGREPYYPYAASREFDSPWKVAAKVLAELRAAAVEEDGEEAAEHVVVTVPASFQLAARRDTFRAAAQAGVTLGERGLFDEPNAALLDYLFTVAHDVSTDEGMEFVSPRSILVFDFGGGTCDISISRAQIHSEQGRLDLANLSISRYERLGGDNIDTAIAEEILLPEFLRQNGFARLDLTWAEKKHRVLPTLASVAEALKLGLCAEYSTQLALRPDGEIDRKAVVATQLPVSVWLPARGANGAREMRECVLTDPSLTLEEFERLLAPMLDPDFLYTRETEFNTRTSIFAPIIDALQRAPLEPRDIDAVLLVGGSSLIPQVEAALRAHFPTARILRFPDADRTRFAVARGAALQSFFLHGLGRPLIRPIAQEAIGILTQGTGFVPLIPAGTELPFPGDGTYARYNELTVPRDLMRQIEVVLAADGPAKVLGVGKLQLSSTPAARDRITLEWRLDSNKILDVSAWLEARPDIRCELQLENPLCSTGFQSKKHRRILELEQIVAEAAGRRAPPSDTVAERGELARLYYDLGRHEKALDWARAATQAAGKPNVWFLQLMAWNYEALGARDRAEKCYREALATDDGAANVHFGLSISLERQGRHQEALAEVNRAIDLVLQRELWRGCVMLGVGNPSRV